MRVYYDRSDGSSVTSDVRREDHTFDIENQLNDRKVFDWNYATSQLTQTGSDFTFTYDANGNMVSSATTGSVKVDMQNRIYEAGAWRYRYDAFGRRIEKRDITTGALVTSFGSGGVVVNDFSLPDLDDDIWAIAVDASYVYVAGYESVDIDNSRWRIMKLLK